MVEPAEADVAADVTESGVDVVGRETVSDGGAAVVWDAEVTGICVVGGTVDCVEEGTEGSVESEAG